MQIPPQGTVDFIINLTGPEIMMGGSSKLSSPGLRSNAPEKTLLVSWPLDRYTYSR
uniref:Uncharacterized protein n=1 Tax=Utricularia reniformis TaxID=192314 RepID=A0A1Y0B0G1_9LAMI|nr:hypothetical protein AEK19_MT0688 [Utricularia reniformis]ART30936.1 hypothetical protein AEK19_MT0688 [Utricularia reniformis]